MANVSLYYSEHKWILNSRKSNRHNTLSFANTFRFIDDLCVINENGLPETYHKEIYPENLEFKRENVTTNIDEIF